MENTLSNLQVSYRQDLDILFCRWLQPCSSVTLQKGYLHALEKAKELQVHYWLFDLRRRGPVSTEDGDWILKTFFPKTEATIPGKHYFSYLVTPNHYQHLQEEIGLISIQQYSARTKIYVFDSEQKAINWISSSR